MIYPMFAMVVLTLAIGVMAFVIRVNSVRQGTVDPRSYKLMDAENFPDAVTKTTRSLSNQFEIPVLFYVACLAFLALGISSKTGLFLAWLFVAFRVLHAYIHLTYNLLLHRIVAFWLSVFTVLALWICLLISAVEYT